MSLLIALICATWGQTAPGGIWEAPVMAQPFDTQPFRPVRIPEWVQDTTGCGYTFSGLTSEMRARAAAHGVTISEVNFVDPYYPYYESKLLHKRSPHVPMGKIEEDIAEYKRLGVRVLGVYPPCLQGEVWENHPDWRRIATNTTDIPEVDLEKYPHGGMLCLLGPYGDFFAEVLAEIVTMHPGGVDAFSFDGLHYGGVCYCQHCRANYRADTGLEIPDVNMDDPAFRRYQHWADRRMEDTVRRVQIRLKGIDPDIALVTWTTNAGRFGHFRDIPRNMPARMNLLFDAPDQEFWLDESNRGATIVPAFANAYIWATTNHRVAFSEPYLMSHGNPYGKDSFPVHEVFRRMMLALTHGAGPSIAVGQTAELQEGIFECLHEVRQRKPWLTHKEPEPWGALVMSDNTRVFYGRSPGHVEDRYLSHVLGMFRTVLEEHLQMTVICDWNLNREDLSKYRVVVLPNTACLDEAQLAALRGYVEAGGGLVASMDTSLMDVFGEPRPDFALTDLFGASREGLLPSMPDEDPASLDINFARGVDDAYWEKRKGARTLTWREDTLLDTPELRALTLPGTPVTFKGPAVRVRVDDPAADIAATLSAPDSAYPGIVARTHGKGRVVYLAGGYDAAYYLYPYPYQRHLLASSIRWAANAPQRVEVSAPMCVQATVMRQRAGGERLVVHLYNNVNTTAFHALPNDDVPLREETLPIHGITVTFANTYQVSGVRLEPGAIPLQTSDINGALRVEVPPLEVHAMVIAELAGDI